MSLLPSSQLCIEQVDQGARLVDTALESGELFEHPGWEHIAPAAKEGTLHLIGLLSDGGVHSRYDQLKLLFDGVRHHLEASALLADHEDIMFQVDSVLVDPCTDATISQRCALTA